MPVLAAIDLWREVAPGRPRAAGAVNARWHALRAEAVRLARAEALVQPRASWRIVALDAAPDASGTLWLEGRRLDAPRLVPESGRLSALACAAATLGDRLESRVRDLFAQRRVALALALDGVGNALLAALARRMQDRIAVAARRQGLTLAGELRAGDPGLALQSQPDVLALAGATDIGVTLTPGLAMMPAKSTALVQGVGIALPAARWSRCDDCRSRARCRLAAQAA
jgi:hypothetical protein